VTASDLLDLLEGYSYLIDLQGQVLPVGSGYQ